MLVVLMACGETNTTGHTNGNGNNARGPVQNQAKTLTAEELEEVQIFVKRLLPFEYAFQRS